jgi:hypothetical protein
LSIGSAAGAATYPVSARLTLAPEQDQHCLRTPGGGRVDCSVVGQTRAAFAEAVARMFIPREPPDLELVVRVEDAEIFEQVSGGLNLDIVIRVRIQTPDGVLLDDIRSNGRVAVTGASAVEEAAGEAARSAALEFETQYPRSEAVANYLVRSRVAPQSAVALAPRSDRLVWIAGGLGLTQGGDSGEAVTPSARLGISWRWIMLQAMYARWTSSFHGVVQQSAFIINDDDGELHTDDLGIEAGAVIRLADPVELHAGAGLHYLWGSADAGDAAPSASYAKVAPAIFVSITGAFQPFRSGFRFLVGAEARVYFASSVDLLDFSRQVPLANNEFAIFLGGEIPWSSEKGGSR